jgi:Domain of unknown function (DUF4331)
MHRALVAVALAGQGLAASGALPSSHREAPAVAGMPRVDATDFYMFNSYEAGRSGYVTIVADYIPFQTSYGGPNFFQLDPDALYQIHIDNDGDGREDLTFTFRFSAGNQDLALNIGGVSVPVPLYNIGPIGPLVSGNSALNIRETYTLSVVYGDQYQGLSCPVRNAVTGSTTFQKPADFVGRKSQMDYETYAANHIFEISLPGTSQRGRVFVGQRKDPFVANLGEIFDLVNTNPIGPPDGRRDSLADDNTTAMVLEIPATFLRGASGSLIGGWTTASLPQTRILNQFPTFATPEWEQGRWVQVSRLGMPLVNEVLIGLRDKNRFNASRPRDDAQFARYVTNPTLPALLQALFGVTAPCLPRNDLVTAFLTGVPGLNQPEHVRPAEMLRLNSNTDPASGGIAVKPKGQQSYLGVLGGDLAGFPNGRRPGDDVVDISLRVVMGAILPDAGQPGGCAPSGALPYTDGALCNDQLFDDRFPYLRTPVASSPQ